MQTAEFFALVLPDQGFKVIALPKAKGFLHKFYDGVAQAALVAQHLDSKGANVYYALAAFATDANRKGENALAVRSFWLDIDCGPEKPYATQRDGLLALAAFKKELGLPTPYIVNSGNGLHVYWPMDADMTPDEWRSTAVLLKQATREMGLEVDQSRTSDIATVLRPVGTTHRKGAPKIVTVIKSGAVVSHSLFKQTLDAWFSYKGLTPELAGPVPVALQLNNDLAGGIEYPPANAELIAERCGAVKLLKDTQGQVDQPTWYATLGVVAFCENGDALAHEWSSGHVKYDPSETDAKLAQLRQYRPTTCAKIRDAQPAICAACPHKIRSPISLGYGGVEMQVTTTSAANPDVELAIVMPDGFRACGSGDTRWMQCRTTDENGADKWVTFCDSLFYPINRIRTKQENLLEFELHLSQGNRRRFAIPTSTLASGGRDLASELGKQEIVCEPKMRPVIDSYVARWVNMMRSNAQQISTYKKFGWHDDSFLVGNTLLSPGGRQSALLEGTAANKSSAFIVKGDFQIWKDTIDKAYNYPGQEALQYMVMLGFAAPIFAMLDYGGVTVYAHSEGSGVGKTTAQQAALSAWGDWGMMMLAHGKATTNALWDLMGAYHNLPVVFDELTNQQPEVASEIVFSVSSGRPKERCDVTGAVRPNDQTWRTIMLASGNTMLSEKLSLHRENAEAEINRSFEFTVRNKSRLSPNEAGDLFPNLKRHCGHAGLEFIHYVVNNQAKVRSMLDRTQKAFNNTAGITNAERYWSALQASVLVSVRICRKLGIVNFDEQALLSWLMETLEENRAQRKDSVNDPTETFGKMLAEIWQGILVTNGEGDLRRNLFADVLQHPKGPLVGRAINSMDASEKDTLLLNASAVKDWCNKRGASAKELFGAAVARGWVEKKHVRYSLGKGTTQYASSSGQVKCWVVDVKKMGAETRDHMVAQRLKLVTHGEADNGPVSAFGVEPGR